MEGNDQKTASAEEKKLLEHLTSDCSEEKLIQKGAESNIYLCSTSDHRLFVRKDRLKKTWRHQEIDNRLCKSRFKHETKLMRLLKDHGIETPQIYGTMGCSIYMEYIDGFTIKELLMSPDISDDIKRDKLRELGGMMGRLHNLDIVHGDPTACNIMVRRSNHSVVLIDFGLSFVSSQIDNKAADLNLLKRTLNQIDCSYVVDFDVVLEEYKRDSNLKENMEDRIRKVEVRGRKHIL